VQTLVGDQYNLKDENGNAIGSKEGSIGHVLTHAVVGCAAAEAQGGSCQTGAAAGAASAIYAGQLDGSSSGAASNDMAELLSGLAAAVVSSGDAEAVSIAAGIGRSGFVNNRQLHAYDMADLMEALGWGAEVIALVENMTDEQIAQFDQELFTQEYFDSISPEQQRVLAATCALIQCHLHIPQDDFLELGNDAFREELARTGGGTDYLQDRQNLLDNTTNVDAFSYDVEDIYADFELRTGRDLETDALFVSGLDGLASLANFVDGGIAFADLMRRAENGDPEAIKERDEISARLSETLANSDFIDEGFSNAAEAMRAAYAEYSATVALLEAAASGTYVDPDELRDAAFFKAEFETKAVFGAAAILTPTILARVGRFTGNVPDTNVCSFHGDTLVLTNTGLQPIKDLSTSMSVWSRNPADGEMAWKAIQAQYSNPYNETVSVTVRDTAAQTEQTIVSNHIHPYFVQTTRTVVNSSEGHIYAGPLENGHWVDAAELHAGDRLLHDDGTWAEVVDVEIEAEPLTAFNLTVSDFHTYFVAANENAAPVWVHNDCWDADAIDNDLLDFSRTENGRPVYDYLDPETGEVRSVYQGTDGRYYDANDHPMDNNGSPTNLDSDVDVTPDTWTRMTSPEATRAASDLGYQKTNFTSRGQPVYFDGQNYITPDVDGHNGGTWKMADSIQALGSKATRTGTFDSNLERIGD
jgi:hypothetical protein